MSKTFDELFNDFLKKLRGDKDESLKDESSSDNIFNIERVENLLENFGESNKIDEEVEKTLDESLGEPHKIEHYTEGGLFYEKRTWNTPKGDFVKLIIREKTIRKVKDIIAPSLDEQLEKALATENYETACVIRDLINAEVKKDN